MTNTGEKFFQTFFGQSLKADGTKSSRESVKTSLYWGLHTSKVKDIIKPNDSGANDFNPLVKSLTKFLPVSSEVRIANSKENGGQADAFNNNKFSLSVFFKKNKINGIEKINK